MDRPGQDQTTTSRKRKRQIGDSDNSSAGMPSYASSQRDQRPAADQARSNPASADDAAMSKDKHHEPAATKSASLSADITRRDPDEIPPWLAALGFPNKADLVLLRTLLYKMLNTVGIDRDELNIQHLCTAAYESVIAIEDGSYGEKHPLLPQWRQILRRLTDHRDKDLLISEEQMLSILPYYHARRQPRKWSLRPPSLVSAETVMSETSAGQGDGMSDAVADEDRMDVDMQ